MVEVVRHGVRSFHGDLCDAEGVSELEDVHAVGDVHVGDDVRDALGDHLVERPYLDPSVGLLLVPV